MKKTFTFISCFVIGALILSAAPVSSSTDKGRGTSTKTISLTAAQDPPVVAGQLIDSPRQDPELSRRLRKYDLIRMDPGAAAAQVRTKGQLSLKTSKDNFDLQLTPNDLRAPNYSAQVIGPDGVARKLPKTPLNTFKGTVKGSERAQARFTITEGGVEGAIVTERNRYFLQPASDLSGNAKKDEFVFYEASDLTEEGTSCGLTLAEEIAAREEMAASASKTERTAQLTSPVPPLSPMKLVQLATDADAEYVTALGGASQANTRIATIMNFVDGIYQVEIGVTFQIVFQNTWTNSATDPYTTTVPSALLGEFRNHWNANFTQPQHARDLAHLWTGKDLDGGTIGIASLAVVCRDPSRSYGLSQRFPVSASNPITAQTIVLTTHEIGHNFAAFHTNEADTEIPPDIERACENTIMEASVGSGAAFCAFSRSEITGHANAFSSCLSDAAVGPPSFPACTETPIDGTGLTANGSLANTDCRSTFRGVEFFADQYSFNGIAGQRVSITLVHTSGTLDPYLYLIGPDGYPVSQDDDGNGNLDSRIPGSGTIALPMTGKYVLEATSFDSQATGNYTITVTQSGCTLSVTPTSQHFSSAGGSGNINVTATGTCGNGYQFTQNPNTASWLSPQLTGGVGSQSLPFNVAANSNSAGRRAFLLVGPSASDFSGGISIPITQSGTGPDCSVTSIAVGQTLNGTLGAGDCHSPIRGNGFLADRYTFNATAGQKVAIQASSAQFDTYLELMGPNDVVLLKDDDSGGNSGGTPTNSRIPGGAGLLTLGTTGTYTVEITAFDTTESGAYSLTLTGASASGTIQLSQATFNIVESQTSMIVTATRAGDTSGAATVDYATSDTAGTATCPSLTGVASSRCDYITTLGTLTFAAGETSKQILIPIVDDVHPEGSENFSITLSNPSGATLGGQVSATLTITDSDAPGASNPIDGSSFFVRQHYLDFLNREPDAGGLAFWTNQMTNCSVPPPADLTVCKVNVSAAFFLAIEFQETGFLAYRVYKSAFGNLAGAPVPVRFLDFLRDSQRIGQGVQVGIGNWQAQLEANKQAYVLAFVQRIDFQNAYPNSLTAAQFVDQVNGHAGGVLSAAERNNLIANMTVPSNFSQRATVLRAIAEDQDLRNAETNKAFVLMQYFGYLRRNPDDVGFDGNPDPNFNGFTFWLNKLIQFNGNFEQAEMVKAFIASIEYRQRFGQ